MGWNKLWSNVDFWFYVQDSMVWTHLVLNGRNSGIWIYGNGTKYVTIAKGMVIKIIEYNKVKLRSGSWMSKKRLKSSALFL